MKNHPFKSFVVYTAPLSLISQLVLEAHNAMADGDSPFDGKIEENVSRDPGNTVWRSAGFVTPINGREELLTEVQRGVYLLSVQHNERILPGKVRDEHLLKRVAEIEEREGRQVHRKEYAQLREEVEFSLLPRAFIRRTRVYVMFTMGKMFVFTGSAKRADDTLDVVRNAIDLKGVRPLDTVIAVEELFIKLVRDGSVEVDDIDANWLLKAGSAGVFHGPEKSVVRVKDCHLVDDEVQRLIDESYVPTQAQMKLVDCDDDSFGLTATMNDKYVFKGVQFDDTTMERQGSDEDAISAFFAFTLLVNRYYNQLVNTIVDLSGGLLKHEEKKPTEALVDAVVEAVSKHIVDDEEDWTDEDGEL